MILLLNTCSYELHTYEFLKPLEAILKEEKKKYLVKHITEDYEKELEKVSHVIICGNSLLDQSHLKHTQFVWIETFRKPLLGICAGAQILAKVSGAKLKKEITIGTSILTITEEGKKDPLFKNWNKKEDVYLLHSTSFTLPKEIKILAHSKKGVLVFSLQKKYGVLFHSEVRHKELIVNFINLK